MAACAWRMVERENKEKVRLEQLGLRDSEQSR